MTDISKQIYDLALNLNTLYAISMGVQGVSVSPFQGIGTDLIKKHEKTTKIIERWNYQTADYRCRVYRRFKTRLYRYFLSNDVILCECCYRAVPEYTSNVFCEECGEEL